jgi:sugar phosphate isomerase/epimerase
VIVSAFADEIASDVAVQVAVLEHHGVRHVDLRAVHDSNVIELDDVQVVALRDQLHAHGIAVATIASPIGKEPADCDPAALLDRLSRAAAVARLLSTDLIRVFAFCRPESGADWKGASLRSVRALASCARQEGVTLLLENEVRTWADTAERAAELLGALGDAPVCAAFDPANALRCGDTPYPDGYAHVKPWLRQVHVKDLDENGTVVPAGFGRANWPALLKALRSDGYQGFVSLEPHLLRAGRAGGFTGPTLFAEAHRALQELITSNTVRSVGAAIEGDGVHTPTAPTKYPQPTEEAWETRGWRSTPEKRRGTPLSLKAVSNQPTVLTNLSPRSYGATMAASRRARNDTSDERLLIHSDGTVRDATTASVFWAKDGVLKTAALENGIQPAIARVVVTEALETQEVSATLDELFGADEVFLVSTSRQVQPVRSIDDVEYEEAPGPLCRAARRALDRAIAHETSFAENNP